MKATFVKDLTGFTGSAKLYRVDPPVKFDEDQEADHIAVSQVCSGWAHETYAFPADKDGTVVNWGELEGSMRGAHSHEEVVEACGYTIEK